MYIPAYWCGVASTLLAEFIGIVIFSIVSEHKKRK